MHKLASESAQSEKRNREAEATIVDLEQEKMRQERDLQAQQAHIERERKLNDAATKSALLRTQSECTSTINEQKATCENEKRQLMVYVADAFKQFFNPQDIINERMVKKIVDRAREELVQLTESNHAVRRLVGAESGRRTDDAVAQLLLGRV
jgi:DNA anti-recombination protein RmuC